MRMFWIGVGHLDHPRRDRFGVPALRVFFLFSKVPVTYTTG